MNLKRSTLPFVVLALLLTGTGLLGGSPQNTAKPLPAIFVETSYPGANATVVADTVAAPIEQQVNGVMNSLHMMSHCTNDGRYVLTITFKRGTNLDIAKVLVQNRVALALPTLPDVVKHTGVTIKTKSPIRMLVSLSAPDGRHDTLYLSNYATFQIKDELARVPGVAEIAGIGMRDFSMRVWLDPLRLTARKLVASDVAKALEQQNVQIAVGQPGQPPAGKIAFQYQLTVKALGRLTEPKEFEDIIIKTDDKSALVRLKDVGRVELGAQSAESYVSLNGKPGVILGFYPTGGESPKELSRAVADKLKILRARLPKGLLLEVAFDFTANLEAAGRSTTAEYLLLDLQYPEPASAERMRENLASCEKLLRDVPGVQDVLAVSTNPFDIFSDQPCILMRLAPGDQPKVGREEITRNVRTKLEKIPDAMPRLRDLSRMGSFPRCGYPIDLAISGPEADKVQELAQKLAERLQKSKKLTDVWANQDGIPRASLYVDIDRKEALKQGLALQDIYRTIQIAVGSLQINEFIRYGGTGPVSIQIDDKFRKRAGDLKQIKLRNGQGQMIPLASVATVRTSQAPTAINRLDFKPMVQITANPAAEMSLAQARMLCESIFEQLRMESRLQAEYRLNWLNEISTQK
jgi:multidrug efflux pump subunit AcrB